MIILGNILFQKKSCTKPLTSRRRCARTGSTALWNGSNSTLAPTRSRRPKLSNFPSPNQCPIISASKKNSTGIMSPQKTSSAATGPFQAPLRFRFIFDILIKSGTFGRFPRSVIMIKNILFLNKKIFQVKNISFEKSVAVRMTFDAWRTYTDIEGTFLKNAYEGDWYVKTP